MIVDMIRARTLLFLHLHFNVLTVALNRKLTYKNMFSLYIFGENKQNSYEVIQLFVEIAHQSTAPSRQGIYEWNKRF